MDKDTIGVDALRDLQYQTTRRQGLIVEVTPKVPMRAKYAAHFGDMRIAANKQRQLGRQWSASQGAYLPHRLIGL